MSTDEEIDRAIGAVAAEAYQVLPSLREEIALRVLDAVLPEHDRIVQAAILRRLGDEAEAAADDPEWGPDTSPFEHYRWTHTAGWLRSRARDIDDAPPTLD